MSASRMARWHGIASATGFVAQISGAGEVPPLRSAGHGWARMRLADGDIPALSYQLKVFNLEGVVQAHIHHGSPDENGPVVAFLLGPQDPGGLENGTIAQGTIEEADLIGPLTGDMPAFVEALRAGELYVNVHTAANPSGELRGQLGAMGRIGQGTRLIRKTELPRLR